MAKQPKADTNLLEEWIKTPSTTPKKAKLLSQKEKKQLAEASRKAAKK